MNILIFDIETLREMFHLGMYFPEENKYLEFSIDKDENDIYRLLKFIEDHQEYHWVGFNNLSFDNQVIEYIIRNHKKWLNKSNLEVAKLIQEKADDTIDNSNSNRHQYSEQALHMKIIDVFKIHHFDNAAKRTSLKWAEFTMGLENIEDMPIHHMKENLTSEEIQAVKDYCKADVFATYYLYKYTIGETDNPEYKGKDKILDRLNLIEEVGLPCLNWSDVTIGEEWNRLDYTNLTGRRGKDLFPSKVRYFYGKKYKEFFPNTVEFQTEEVKKFVQKVGDAYITRPKKGRKKQEFYINLNGNTICIGRGGLHSSEGPRYMSSDEDYQYIQVDIGSQYPNAYRKYGIYPLHLGKEANTIVTRRIHRRLEDKAMYKKTKDPKYASLQEMGKLALNGGLYGKLKQKGSFLEDHICQLQVTMGCQLEILMIVEALVLKGFNVVSLNTDGFDVLVDRERLDEFGEVCTFYQDKIGNSEIGQLEYTAFQWIAQMSVNDYVAKKIGSYEMKDKKLVFKEDRIVNKDSQYPDLKTKGMFVIDTLLNKNPSRRVIPLALLAFFDKGIPIDEFILNHNNIFDFCIGIKSNADYYYKMIKDSEETVYDQRATRYYVSEYGGKLLKIKREGSDAKGDDVSECEAPELGRIWLCRVANKIDKSKHISDYKVDYRYYIQKTEDILRQIQAGRKKKGKFKRVDPNQIKLF